LKGGFKGGVTIMLRVIEAFSGIGSQVQALKNIDVEHEIKGIIEWEIGAIIAYDLLHNGGQDLTKYRHHTKESIVEILSEYSLSNDGSSPITERSLSSMNIGLLRSLLCAIERTNNFVDITKVRGELLPEADVLTYSFPCQDLSVSGYWHSNSSGIDRNAKNRSTLLWEIERILIEIDRSKRQLPRFLLMENVSNILSDKHIDNFLEFKSFLESLGYINQVYTLDARNFGTPQSRIRTYMISVRANDLNEADIIKDFFFMNNLEQVTIPVKKIDDYLRLDYTVEKYRIEAIESTPAFTPSREKIYKNNVVLATDQKVHKNAYARTITTKQDRHPNSGIIEYKTSVLTDINSKYRNLTPRECFLLMGFSEEGFDSLVENNIPLRNGSNLLSLSKLIKLAGNSIVVPVLENIFSQIENLHGILNTHQHEMSAGKVES